MLARPRRAMGAWPTNDGLAAAPSGSGPARPAQLRPPALRAGLGGRRPLEAALAGYERARDRAVLPMYEFTGELASFAPPRAEQQALFAARPRSTGS
jgi:hypothetical protein